MKPPQKIDVSVLTPVYDEPFDYLKRNMISVGQDTKYKVEHIIVLDNPGLASQYYEKIKRAPFGVTEMQIVMYDQNKGLPGARNEGLKVAKGEYVMLLDCDDAFTLDRIDNQVDFMKRNELDHSYGGYQEIHGLSDKKSGPIIPETEPKQHLLNGQNVCYCGSNCFRRDVIDKIGYFDEKLNGLGAEDLEYWVRLVNSGLKSKGISEVLYYLGITDQNMTAKYLAGGQFEQAYRYIASKHSNFIQK